MTLQDLFEHPELAKVKQPQEQGITENSKVTESEVEPNTYKEEKKYKDYNMWAEKHRPKSLDQIKGQKLVVARLKKFVAEGSFPHLLLAGVAGVGKTTAALALIHDLYGEESDQSYMELNASSDRGINIIRERVKQFASTKSISSKVPFKILVLDECEGITFDGQNALRRIMEIYSANVRFILITNMLLKIIEPIRSRCSVFMFAPLDFSAVKEYLSEIAKAENITITDDAYAALVDISRGDLRKCVNILQSCAESGKTVTKDIVESIVGEAPSEEINKLLVLTVNGQVLQAISMLRDLIKSKGLTAQSIIDRIHYNLPNLGISESMKVRTASLLGEVSISNYIGFDDELLLESFLAKLALASVGSEEKIEIKSEKKEVDMF